MELNSSTLKKLISNPVIATALVGLAASTLRLIPLSSILILAPCVGLKHYEIVDKETTNLIQQRVKHSSSYSHDGKACGYGIGRWFICSIKRAYDDSVNVSMLTTPATFTQLIANDIPPSPLMENILSPINTSPTTIKVCTRVGPYYRVTYKKRKIPFHIYTPHDGQKAIMDSIITHYDSHIHTVAFIYGLPGIGKSMLGLLLAKHYDATFINTLKPWEPGNYIEELYAEVKPAPDAPLVIVFDEIDVALTDIHTGIPPHDSLSILISNKPGWNLFMDEIERGMYPYLILLMTSNRPAEYVDSLDKSYLRPGRVNVCMELTGPTAAHKN